MKIRPYCVNDYDDVVNIMLEAFSKKISKFTNLTAAENVSLFKDLGISDFKETNSLLVAELDGQVAGAISLIWHGLKSTTRKSKKNNRYLIKTYGFLNLTKFIIGLLCLDAGSHKGECYVDYIAVAEGFRGRGIGTLLLDAGESFAIKACIDTYSLNVIGSNKAKELYEKVGFKVTRTSRSILNKWIVGDKTIYKMIKYL